MRWLTRIGFAACVGIGGAVGSSDAQSLAGSFIVGERSGALVRIAPGGPSSTIGVYTTGGSLNSIALDVGNDDVLATIDDATSGGHLLRINLTTGTATTVAKGLGRVWSIKLDQNGDYLVGTFVGSPLMHVSRNGATVRTIGTFRFAPLYEQDVSTGDWILSHAGGDLIHYEYDFSRVRTSIGHSSAYAYNMDRDPHQARIYVAAGDLIAYDPGPQIVTTLDPTGSGQGVSLRGIAVDRSPAANGALIYVGTAPTATSTDVHIHDRAGTNLGIAFSTTTSKASNFVAETSRNLWALMGTPPNDRFLVVSFPADAIKQYIVAFSLTGFTPNIPLPDGRIVPLTPDPLTQLTAAQSLPPLIVGNHGTLGTNGQAQARLNLNQLGSAVNGVRVWAVAVSLDPAAPLGIAQISAPIVLVL